jgi:serine phosphatase RsbU (regulator of sigma subunit)/anti-sigma regulatory factor (Ser/Thr protein kinase)
MDFQVPNNQKNDKQRTLKLISRCRELKTENVNLSGLLKEHKSIIEQKNIAIEEAACKLNRINFELEEELETARRIQENLMPAQLPELVNIKVAAVYIPTGKVGGDLYDIISTPHQKIAVLIFDVSGHGIPAALIGAMAKMLFAHFIEKTESPAEVFGEVNKQLCNFIKTEQYLTAFLGFIDPIKNCMVYSRAGHVSPMIHNSRNGQIVRLDSKGFFIGHSALLDIVEYRDCVVQLDPGDKILFYTDGLTECVNDRYELYGGERLMDVFKKCGSGDVQKVIDFIVADQASFRKGTSLRDDFTILCIEMGDSEFLLTDSGFTREDEPNILIVNKFVEIEKVCALVLKEMDRSGFDDKAIKQFKICIFEMLTNALQHGNQGDESKNAIVFYKVTPFSATISVVDEGNGFDHRNVPDPLLPENRMKDHGRGIFLIRHYLDEVEYNEKGNRVLGRKYHLGK